MEVFVIVIVLILLVAVAGVCLAEAAPPSDESLKREKELKEQEERSLRLKEESRQKFIQLMTDFETRLGKCTSDIHFRKWKNGEDTVTNHILIYEEAQVVVMYAHEYKFSDILGCSLVDNSTNQTITSTKGEATTSTGSMLGRAVVGGVLTGGLGAVAGAATAKKNIGTSSTSVTTTKHEYKVFVNVNSLQDPMITFNLGEQLDKAYKIANLMNVIVERNKK